MQLAGYREVRVIDAPRAVAQLEAWGALAQLKKSGIDAASLRRDTPDYVLPLRAPYLGVIRYPSDRGAQRVVRGGQVTTVCNVIVFSWTPGLRLARDGAARIATELRRRCR